MNQRRDLLKEIHEKRSRYPTTSDRFDDYFARIKKITAIYDYIVTDISNAEIKKEMYRYIPISLVAAMESYFRAAISDLIDQGELYSNRLENLRDLRIPISIVSAIHGRKLSLGQFVSHIVPLSSLDAINKNMSILLDFDFFDRMKNSVFVLGVDQDSLIPADDDLFSGLSKTYDLRNIFCHEAALGHDAEPFDIVWGLFTAEYFVSYTEVMLLSELSAPNES